MVKNLPAMQETWVWSLAWEDPLEEGMVTTPVCFPGESHGQRSPVGYSLLLLLLLSRFSLVNSVRPHRRQLTRLPCPWDSPGKNTGVGCHFLLRCMKVKSESEVAQLCPNLWDLMDCSLPGSSVHGIFQARVLEWVAITFSDLISVLNIKWCKLYLVNLSETFNSVIWYFDGWSLVSSPNQEIANSPRHLKAFISGDKSQTF